MEQDRKRIEKINVDNLVTQISDIQLKSLRNNQTIPEMKEFDGLLRMHRADVLAQAENTQPIKNARLDAIEMILPKAYEIGEENFKNGVGRNLAELKALKKAKIEELERTKAEYRELTNKEAQL